MSANAQTSAGRFVWHDHMSDDPGAAASFYSELLGWEIEVWKPGEVDYPMIKAHDRTHGGFGPAQGGAPPHWLGHVAVEDADAAAERAESAGGSVVAPAMEIPEVGRMIVVADPQGAVVSLFTPAGEPPPSDGAFVWDELLTTDVEGSKRFYEQVVGWESREMDMGEGVAYTLFGSGGVDRAGCFALTQDAEAPPHWLCYVYAADVDATAAKAEELGARTATGPVDVRTVGRLAVLADPQGAYFGLFTPDQA